MFWNSLRLPSSFSNQLMQRQVVYKRILLCGSLELMVVGGQSDGNSPGPLSGSSKDVLDLPGQSSNFDSEIKRDLQESKSPAQHRWHV